MSQTFFDEPLEQSLVKSEIVVAYFMAWSRIMAKRAARIGYLDFYAGPGRYQKSGTKSTPLLILEEAVESPDLSQRLVTLFNDADPDFVSSLRKEVKAIPGIERLRFEPEILNQPVDDSLVTRFERMKTIPSLSFIDPWGYKGLSLRLIRAVV